MKRFSGRVWIGWLLILISLILLLWGFYPIERERRERRIFPQELQLPTLQEVLPDGLRWT
ncbi:MAG: hypothetical protein ANABAC_2380 [Anaerolineae bacterium]|nr:MAG: hypothetical protein ANABAC_2380 [Anaerolineae bacterium]